MAAPKTQRRIFGRFGKPFLYRVLCGFLPKRFSESRKSRGVPCRRARPVFLSRCLREHAGHKEIYCSASMGIVWVRQYRFAGHTSTAGQCETLIFG